MWNFKIWIFVTLLKLTGGRGRQTVGRDCWWIGGGAGYVGWGTAGTPWYSRSRSAEAGRGTAGASGEVRSPRRTSLLPSCDAGEPCDASRCEGLCTAAAVAAAAEDAAVVACSTVAPVEHLPSLPLKQCASPLLSAAMNLREGLGETMYVWQPSLLPTTTLSFTSFSA